MSNNNNNLNEITTPSTVTDNTIQELYSEVSLIPVAIKTNDVSSYAFNLVFNADGLDEAQLWVSSVFQSYNLTVTTHRHQSSHALNTIGTLYGASRDQFVGLVRMHHVHC